jgi:hypothetical protein
MEADIVKWMTKEHIRVGRMGCAWLIRRFIDPAAEFVFVPAGQLRPEAERLGATLFHAEGAELVADGLALLYDDDHALNEAGGRVYDALYAYCQEMIRRGKPDGAASG